MIELGGDDALGLAVAVGAGLLIGVERERRKGEKGDRAAAGIRTFTVAAATGALAQLLPVPGLVVLGGFLVALLAAVSHWKSRSRDPGLTTELALFTTYLIGVQSVITPALGAACAAGLAALLAARQRLHRFATQWLSQDELHDGLLLAAFALIVLPLIPARPLPWLGGIEPRPLAALVLLILALQAAGHVALRVMGARAGLLAAGFASGFVSSTATVASYGTRARSHPHERAALAGGAALSAVATWVQAMLMTTALSPAAAAALLPVAAAGAAGCGAVGLTSLRAGRGTGAAAQATHRRGSALRPREAIVVALLLAAVALAVGSARRHFGDLGLDLGVALTALADSHAPIALLASLHAAGSVATPHFAHGVMIAIGVNSASRALVALATGGAAYALRVALALALGFGLAFATMLATTSG